MIKRVWTIVVFTAPKKQKDTKEAGGRPSGRRSLRRGRASPSAGGSIGALPPPLRQRRRRFQEEVNAIAWEACG